MRKIESYLSHTHQNFIKKQPIFFTGTADCIGSLNLNKNVTSIDGFRTK